MKGVVFTEFLEMVESVFGDETVDDIIDASDLPSQGVYTAVGTYDHQEMVSLVTQLSARTQLDVSQLLLAFGRHLFGRFFALYPSMFVGHTSSFSFLQRIENHIHIEVRKLYPDAELPRFTCEQPNETTLVMLYESSRGMADFAEGLMQGCIQHFQENISIERVDLSGGANTRVRFVLTRSS